MRKGSLIFLIIISFLLMVPKVEAAGRGEIDYDITSIDITDSTVTVKGWAIVGGYNNYGGVLTNIKLVAKSPNRNTEFSGKVVLQNTSLNYGSNINYYGDSYCYQRECVQALDANGSPIKDPNTGNTWLKDKYSPAKFTYKGNCFYRNMYFTATFSTADLKYLGSGVYFNLIVEYNTAHENVDKCSVNSSDKATASNILNAINNGNYRWGYNSSKTKVITVSQNECRVNGNQCQSSNKLKINGKDIELRIRNTNDLFRLSFDTDDTIDSLGATNVHKDLICENTSYQSVKSGRVSFTVSHTETRSNSSKTCKATVSDTLTASYQVIQSGDLEFSLDRGPIYSGGNFTFGVSYVNAARWYYQGTPDACKVLRLTLSVPGTCRSCSSRDENGKCTDWSHYDCCKTGETITVYGRYNGKECRDIEDAKKIYEKLVAKKEYDGLNSSTKVNLPKDSNSVKRSNETKSVGTWTCGSVVDIYGNKVRNNSTWTPGEEWITACTYTLPSAMLNKKTADVEYNVNYRGDEWIEEGNSYFIPLKWPTGTFPIKSSLNGLSSISGINWTATYECDVEVKQMLYDLDDGGYLFFYRPISLSNPFPDRAPSTNWIEWWNNSSNQRQLNDSYNNLEYTLNLSPSNLRDIRVYNSDKLRNAGNLGYLDYSINPNGTSNFFSQRYVSTGFNRSTSDYTRLGAMSR